jgi:hypothetical protein
MESTYTLESNYLRVQSAQASYTKERFAPEGPLQAEALLARVTTQLNHAKHAYEALAYGNQQARLRIDVSPKDQDQGVAAEVYAALYRYKEMLDAYHTVTLVLGEEGAGLEPKRSLLEACHERMLTFLQNLLLTWIERLSK